MSNTAASPASPAFEVDHLQVTIRVPWGVLRHDRFLPLENLERDFLDFATAAALPWLRQQIERAGGASALCTRGSVPPTSRTEAGPKPLPIDADAAEVLLPIQGAEA